ncbi:MAG: thiamine phosphate synthase [Clostridium sp.]|nr:thiamine phosphate synthase [Clostridium sp.]
MKDDYLLYLVTDRGYINKEESSTGAALCEAVEQAILGGVTMVQLREKKLLPYDFYYLAEKVKAVADRHGVPLIINDRADIALSMGAAGIHIGQKDIPTFAARKIIGPDMLLGVSVSTEEEALQAWQAGADYLGVGAIFPTRTKNDAKLVSMEELMAIRKAVPLPLVAIGGINRENAAELMKLGVNGVAVVSAILAKPDVRKAAEDLKFFLRRGSGIL